MSARADWIAYGKSKITQLGQIRDGYVNLVLDTMGELPPAEKELYQARAAICDDCPVRTGNTCSKSRSIQHHITGDYVTGCGCGLDAAVKAPTKECPAGKWGRVDHLLPNYN